MSSEIKDSLERLYRTFHRPEYLNLDPLEWVHEFSDPLDQQVAAVLVAVLSHGAVEQIRKSSRDLLSRLQSEFGSLRRVLDTEPVKLSRALKGFYYRFNREEDFVRLLLALGTAVQKNGSLKDWVQACALNASATQIAEIGILGACLGKMQQDLFLHGEIPFLWSDPAKGSACKRLCMLFRWMVRRDTLDLGHWSGPVLSAKDLVIPLDVHLWRWAKHAGWTKRSAPSWKAAREVSLRFAEFDANDPIRFDFALCRSGMLASRKRHK